MTAVDGVLALGIVLGCIGATVAVVWARRTVGHRQAAGVVTPPDWIWTVDLQGRFLSSNESCLDVLGYTADELVGQNAAIVMDPRELLRAEAMVKAAGVPQEGLGNLIISATHRDGSSSWCEVRIQPEVDASGAMVGCRGVSRLIGPDAAQVVASRAMRSRIQRIIDNRLLVTAFQPIVDVRTGSVIGVEALSRMTAEPSSRPDIWFAEAAAVGLGTELELVAIDTALSAAAALPPALSISLNASPETCTDERLAAMIGSSAIDPRRLVLEVTEHSRVLDYGPLTAALCRFRQSGVRIAVDDAGAGFASGQHIVKIRPDIIKLDRSIISGIDIESDQRALAAGYVAFAGHIGAVLTAEGIQTAEEATAVAALGIHCGQGYLFGAATVDLRVWRSWNCLPLQGRQRSGPPAATETAVLEPSFGAAVLDALPDPTAVVDSAGVIIAVNRAWRTFALEGGGTADATGVGTSYLDVCSRAAATGSAEALEALNGLRAVLIGDAVVRESEYACHGNWGARWFTSRVSAIGAGAIAGGGGAVVSHVNVTRQRRSEAELAQRSSVDPVTGLMDRALFERKLKDSLRTDPDGMPGHLVGVVSVNLEGLGAATDRYGHAAGDGVLLIAAERLTALVRPQDTVARTGSDRFAVCAPGIDEAALLSLSDRISTTLGQPYPTQGRQFIVAVGVGSHLASGGMNSTEAIRAADHDLYAVERVPQLTATPSSP